MGLFSRAVAELNDLKEWGKQMPFGECLKVFRQMRQTTNGGFEVSNKRWDGKVFLRNNISDKAIFRQVFFENQYSRVLDLMPNASFIIDAGANIGMASRYFHQHYPQASVIAIEPESSNFQQLQRNIAGIEKVKPINAAIWHKPGKMGIQNKEAMAASFMVAEADEGFDAVTIPMLMEMFNAPVIDILKMDIEGAEKELLENDAYQWLSKTKLLIIELHDEMKAGCSKALVNALQPFNFTMVQNHENLFVKFDH